jgi:hypothetical protein
MAEASDSDKGARSGAPSTDSAGSTAGSAPDPKQRTVLLDRAIFDRTREARATLRSRGEFEATIVRVAEVRHRHNAGVFAALVALAIGIPLGFSFGPASLPYTMAVPGAYAVWWLFLTVTAGEQLEQLSVDERGTVTSTRSGPDIESRGDILRVAIPVIVIVACGTLALGLVRDIANPPPPSCNVPVTDQPDSCLSLAFMGDAVVGKYVPTATPAPSPSPAPSASPSAGPSDGPSAAATASGTNTQGFSVSQTIALERVIRGFQLLIVLAVLLGASWFLRRMLTGQWVASVRPVRHRAEE